MDKVARFLQSSAYCHSPRQSGIGGERSELGHVAVRSTSCLSCRNELASYCFRLWFGETFTKSMTRGTAASIASDDRHEEAGRMKSSDTSHEFVLLSGIACDLLSIQCC